VVELWEKEGYIMPMVQNIEKKIYDVEKFAVKMLSSSGVNLRGNKRVASQYGYGRRMDGNATVSEWISGRFLSTYPGFTVEVLDVVGIPVAGQTRLKTVRKTYEED
jgi:hypothetical protein